MCLIDSLAWPAGWPQNFKTAKRPNYDAIRRTRVFLRMRTTRRGSHIQYRLGRRMIGTAKPYQLVIVETPASYERRFRRLKPVSWAASPLHVG